MSWYSSEYSLVFHCLYVTFKQMFHTCIFLGATIACLRLCLLTDYMMYDAACLRLCLLTDYMLYDAACLRLCLLTDYMLYDAACLRLCPLTDYMLYDAACLRLCLAKILFMDSVYFKAVQKSHHTSSSPGSASKFGEKIWTFVVKIVDFGSQWF